jgi:hypothetical protein
MRFDGAAETSPWNRPEVELWEWLSVAEIEHVEERGLDGVNGVLWARMRTQEGELRSVLLKLNGSGREHVYKHFASEFAIDPDAADLLKRELAAYEVAKACGMEDLVPPLAPRDIDVVPLLSDAMREKLGRHLRVTPQQVDDRLGIAGIVQLLPRNADNLAETWASMGHDDKARWSSASDRLRHSMYRAMALDFLLGTSDRLIAAYLYNRDTDRLNIMDLTLSFPDPAASTDAYMTARAAGWGRKVQKSLEKPLVAEPSSRMDFHRIFQNMDDDRTAECLLTLEQVTDGLSDDVAAHLASILIEHQVPDQCVAGFLARVAYLSIEPLSVVKRPHDFMRDMLVPLRRGFGMGEARNAQALEYVSGILQRVTGEPFDFQAVIQPPTEEQS